MEANLRSWDVWLVRLILSLLIQEQKKGKERNYNILQKNGIIALKKHVDANHVMLAKDLRKKWTFHWKIY